jgi:hypothetical protein
MKNKFVKIISSLLIVSFLVATFSVFSYAAENTEDNSGSGEILSDLLVFYNRAFDEGWDYSNGFTKTSTGSNSITIDFEEDTLGKYNYFTRFEATTKSAATAYVDFKKDAILDKGNTTKTIVELSVKADDVSYLGKIVWMIMGGSAASNIALLDINAKGEALLFNGVSGGNINLDIVTVPSVTIFHSCCSHCENAGEVAQTQAQDQHQRYKGLHNQFHNFSSLSCTF